MVLLDVVALKEARANHGLEKGAEGAVVEILAPRVYEVEFIDENGRTLVLSEFEARHLKLIRQSPGAKK
jgi:hypothetical protein